MRAGGEEPKKFQDPYAKMGDFTPLSMRLTELGFFTSACTIAEDNKYKITRFSDGSNLLWSKMMSNIVVPYLLYDALEGKLYINKYILQGNGDVFATPDDQLYAEFGTQLVHYGHLERLNTKEMDELRQKKEFRDVFRAGDDRRV